MRNMLEELATPVFAMIDFTLAAPAAALALGAALGLAVLVLIA